MTAGVTIFYMNRDPHIFDRLPYIIRLGLNICIARRHYADPPMSQADLAEKLERSQNYISRIERGLTYPTQLELEQIAELTGLDTSEIKPEYYSSIVSIR